MGHHAAGGSVGRKAAGLLAWLVGTVCAVGVGALSLSLIGSGLGDRSRPPLAAQVGAAPSASGSAQSPSASPSARSTPSAPPHSQPAPTASPLQRTFTFSVGSVTARCDGDQAYLVSWSPAQGYRVDEVRRGPAPIVGVQFESFAGERGVAVRCVAAIPRASLSGDEHR